MSSPRHIIHPPLPGNLGSNTAHIIRCHLFRAKHAVCCVRGGLCPATRRVLGVTDSVTAEEASRLIAGTLNCLASASLLAARRPCSHDSNDLAAMIQTTRKLCQTTRDPHLTGHLAGRQAGMPPSDPSTFHAHASTKLKAPCTLPRHRPPSTLPAQQASKGDPPSSSPSTLPAQQASKRDPPSSSPSTLPAQQASKGDPPPSSPSTLPAQQASKGDPPSSIHFGVQPHQPGKATAGATTWHQSPIPYTLHQAVYPAPYNTLHQAPIPNTLHQAVYAT